MLFNRNFQTGRFLKGNTPHNKGVPIEKWATKEGIKKILAQKKNLRPNPKAIAGKNRKAVVGIKDNKLVYVFPSAREAQRITGISDSDINCCCNKYRNRRTAGGIRWFFEASSEWTKLIA